MRTRKVVAVFASDQGVLSATTFVLRTRCYSVIECRNMVELADAVEQTQNDGKPMAAAVLVLHTGEFGNCERECLAVKARRPKMPVVLRLAGTANGHISVADLVLGDPEMARLMEAVGRAVCVRRGPKPKGEIPAWMLSEVAQMKTLGVPA